MARTQARSGFGLTIKRGDGGSPTEVFTAIPEVTEITPVGGKTRDSVEVTHLNSDNQYKEHIVTLKDTSEIQVTMNWLVGDATQAACDADFEAGTLRNWQIVLPGASKRLEGAAFITEFSPASPRDGAMVRTMKLRPSGKWNEVANP
jgi:predicted secreted protein